MEGNSFYNGTCFAYYGGVFDSVMSGNTMDEMFWSTPMDSMGWHDGLVFQPTPYQSGNIGGGGRVYATSYQNELYNICA